MTAPADGGRVAVIGAGVAGLTAAWLLRKRWDVTIFERNDYIGGHTHTVAIPDGPDAGLPVDTGFIVMNHRNYPLLTRLFRELDVPLRDSDMSFGFHDQHSGLQYAGSDLNALFAQRRNLLRPAFWGMIRDVLRFYRTANTDLAAGIVPPGSLGDYLARGGYGAAFMHDHLIPMGAAIWSTPAARMMDFPAAAFLHFCRNHGLLSLRDRPQWRTVVGGSRVYVDRMLADFDRPPRRQTPARAVRRTDRGVEVVTDRAPAETFDRVILATHADEALALLEHPTPDEQRRLGAWTYTENATVLHTDTAVLPPLPRARASWNYVREADAGGENAPATLSYDMNRLQGLRARRQYLVTLNRRSPYPPGAVIRALNYTHPAYTAAALAAQAELPALNGRDRIWFCGSYFGYGFHEDAVRSAVAVARDFDVNWPGRTAGGGA